MSQERRHGGASREGPLSPDSCGIHSLIGVIDTALLLCDFSVGLPKKGVYCSYSPAISQRETRRGERESTRASQPTPTRNYDCQIKYWLLHPYMLKL